MRALSGQTRFTVLSDRNQGGYDFVATLGGRHIEQPGLQTSLSPLRAFRALRRIARQIDLDAPDLIWAHARMAVLFLRVLAVWRRLRGNPLPPVAITFHGLPFGPGHRSATAPVARGLERAFLRLMPPHHLLFLSDAAADSYARTLNATAQMSRHHVHVLQNCSGLDPLPMQPLGPRPTVVMSGRSGYQKDHETAARIFAQLPADYQLLLCGGGTDDPAFRSRFTHASGLTPDDIDQKVRFLGPLRDIRPILQRADIFLLTSRYEGMPIAALEAFEAGLPLATTEIPGMAEIVAAHPMAVTLPADQPIKAAARIVTLVQNARNDPATNATIRAAWARGFSFPVWQDGMENLVGLMLPDHGIRPQSGHQATFLGP